MCPLAAVSRTCAPVLFDLEIRGKETSDDEISRTRPLLVAAPCRVCTLYLDGSPDTRDKSDGESLDVDFIEIYSPNGDTSYYKDSRETTDSAGLCGRHGQHANGFT